MRICIKIWVDFEAFSFFINSQMKRLFNAAKAVPKDNRIVSTFVEKNSKIK